MDTKQVYSVVRKKGPLLEYSCLILTSALSALLYTSSGTIPGVPLGEVGALRLAHRHQEEREGEARPAHVEPRPPEGHPVRPPGMIYSFVIKWR